MNFDEWMLTKDPKYHQSDDTVQLRRMRECWNDAQRYGGVSADVFPAAHRLALELECILLSCTDTCATAKWWDSANEALEQWREFCEDDEQPHISPLGMD
jgi:hypothetical protein